MGFDRAGAIDKGVRKARVRHGNCKRCGKPIRPTEYYIEVGGSKTSNCGIAHLSCESPDHHLLRI